MFDGTLNEGIIFEIDAGWVLTADYDPAEIIRQYSDRTEYIHLKDMADGEFYELGEGDLDVRQVARVARKEANVDYLIYSMMNPRTRPARLRPGQAYFHSSTDAQG